MLKIEKKVKSDWLIINADFSSLQARQALADEGLNATGVDKIAYDIYGEDGVQDMHSMTAIETLYKPIHKQIIEIEDENGKKFIFGEEQKIKVIKGDYIDDDKEQEILGKEFKEHYQFIGYV